MKKIHILHGPNLNRLGLREPSLYGSTTLAELNAALMKQGQASNVALACMQTNSEATFIDLIHTAADEQVEYLIINPAALTHTSIAIRDALLAVKIPFIEVHISNIYAREPFRHHSTLSDIANGIICGLGTQGYHLALEAAINELNRSI